MAFSSLPPASADYNIDAVGKIKDAQTRFWYRSDGSIEGAIAFRVTGDEVKLIVIGSHRRGLGREMFEYMRSMCKGKRIWCKGLETAGGFYARMGMTRGESIEVGGLPAHIWTLQC